MSLTMGGAVAIITATALFLGLILFAPGVMYAQQPPPPQQQPQLPPLKEHARLTPQEQRLSNCPASVINSTPPLVPGAFPVCPESPLLPPGAKPPQMSIPESVIRQHFNAAEAILNKVKQQVAQHPGTTAAQVLQNMTDQGLINCPAIKNPTNICCLSPKPTGPITPPVAP